MKNPARKITVGGIVAALYVAVSLLQNLLVPGSASHILQFRVAEALCVLAFFTPAAIPGLCVGCAVFDLLCGTTPVDVLAGTAATALAAGGMYLVRRRPWPGFLFPAVCNGLLVGWELSFFLGYGFWLCAGSVALGETAVLFLLGMPLYFAVKANGLQKYL